jgi:hypothetical protein
MDFVSSSEDHALTVATIPNIVTRYHFAAYYILSDGERAAWIVRDSI